MNAILNRSAIGQAAVVALALLGTAGSFGITAGQAHAATGGRYYRVQLEAPVTAARTQVVNDVAFNCAGSECAATKGTSRPEVVCARLAKKVGPIASFTAKGEALDADGLAKCNGVERSEVASK
ncbi:hypothetical protein ACFO0A_03420 [Novosphingobium tardum]|uniref:Secreted protein n=1 Tax=Novosphingobium tardum TaxID=1538021 RepID=A0ABV8RN26_9SPHN